MGCQSYNARTRNCWDGYTPVVKMSDRSFIRSDPESPPAPGRYCQLFSEVAQMLGAPPVPADAVTKIWSIGTDGHLFSIVAKDESAPPGIIVIQHFGEVSEAADSLCIRMHHVNFRNTLDGGPLHNALFSIDPRTQSAVLIQTLVLDELNGPLLIRALQKLADFGHRFRMDADRMTDDTPIKGDLSALL